MLTDDKTILVVDDEPLIRQLLRKLLQGTYTVLDATNGQDAVNIALEHKPSVVLMDLMMPGMDGLTACHRIKSQDESGKVKVVMLTSIDYELNRKLSTSVMKADGYLTKPFEEQMLIDFLAGLFA